jgi:hypothetical protein
MPITDAEVLTLKPKAKPYKVSIGEGAYLLVMPDGKKYWRLKYSLDGQESTYALGVFPKVSANAAKAARNLVKGLIRSGINPTVARRQARETAVPGEPVLRLGISKCGALTIETDTIAVTLTPPHTKALAHFLTSRIEHGKESDE